MVFLLFSFRKIFELVQGRGKPSVLFAVRCNGSLIGRNWLAKITARESWLRVRVVRMAMSQIG